MPFKRLDLSQPLPPIPSRWGRWVLDRENLVLDHPERYRVSLESFHQPAEMLDMIAQVRHKVWARPDDVGYLVIALDDLFDIQSALTPSRVPQRIDDVGAYLRARMEERGVAADD
jgi:hypothetical protein